MTKAISSFEKKGYPSIKIYEEHFEIKAIGYSKFRSFKYSEVQEIKHYNPNNGWWMRFQIFWSLSARYFSRSDPWVLKIIKTNGGDWSYQTSYRYKEEFRFALNTLRAKAREANE